MTVFLLGALVGFVVGGIAGVLWMRLGDWFFETDG